MHFGYSEGNFQSITPPPQKKSKVNSIQKHRELISIINTLPSLLPNVTLLEKMVLYLKLKILQVCLFFLPQRWGSRLNLPSCMRTVDVCSHPRQTQVVKTGRDSSTAKRSATGVSVTGPRRWPL